MEYSIPKYKVKYLSYTIKYKSLCLMEQEDNKIKQVI